MFETEKIGELSIPGDPAAPLRFLLYEHALLIAVVLRQSVTLLRLEDWDAPGVYVLIGPQGGAEKTGVYVGKSGQGGVRGRLSTQKSNPKGSADFDWWKAIAFVRDTTDGFNGAQVGYLENRIAAELGKMPTLSVSSGKNDTDETLPASHLKSLDALIPSFIAGLRLGGLVLKDTSSEDEETSDEEMGKTPGMQSGTVETKVELPDLVAAGFLAAGDVFLFERVGKTAEGVITSTGKMLVSDAEYPKPSPAAKAAYPGEVTAINGWLVWKRKDDGDSLDDIRKEFLDAKSST